MMLLMGRTLRRSPMDSLTPLADWIDGEYPADALEDAR
jgi:hypothetical protein